LADGRNRDRQKLGAKLAVITSDHGGHTAAIRLWTERLGANPSLATYGTFPRNSIRGPGIVNVDLTVSKTTAITERVKFEIRGEFFNFFNHAEFANPDTDIRSMTFGQILNTGVSNDPRPRIIQLAGRITF
jgi:hypothetical protein